MIGPINNKDRSGIFKKSFWIPLFNVVFFRDYFQGSLAKRKNSRLMGALLNL